MCDKSQHILDFSEVEYRDPAGIRSGLSNLDIKLSPSDLLMILLEKHNLDLPLNDLAQGMLMPSEGTVRFRGNEWSSMSPDDLSEARGQIGRVFTGRGWISNLSVYDNIALSRMYHSGADAAAVRSQIDALAEKVGLSSIPEVRTDLVRADDLKKCEWIRAFLGSPVLLLLHCPESSVKKSDVQNLSRLVDKALSDGVAVVWTTTDEDIFSSKENNASFRYSMDDTEMLPIPEGTDE